jgi:hypothetical protein
MTTVTEIRHFMVKNGTRENAIVFRQGYNKMLSRFANDTTVIPMQVGMASDAESKKILLGVVSGMTTKFAMMNFQV